MIVCRRVRSEIVERQTLTSNHSFISLDEAYQIIVCPIIYVFFNIYLCFVIKFYCFNKQRQRTVFFSLLLNPCTATLFGGCSRM